MVEDRYIEENDVEITFMHRCGPTKIFTLPKQNDDCWVAAPDLLLKIDTPEQVMNVYLSKN